MPKISVKKLLSQIRSYISEKDYSAAITASNEVLRLDPENYHALVFVGVASNAQGDVNAALESYQQAIKLRPDLPLAFKGVVQTLTNPSAPAHPLLLARAYYGLATTAPDQAASAFPTAVESFYSLALSDPSLVGEAVSVLRAARASDAFVCQSVEDDRIVHKIGRLLSINTPPQSKTPSNELQTEREKAFDTAPLSSALDDLASVLLRNNDPSFHDGTAELVVERALWRSLRMHNVDENLSFLRNISAYEAILHIAESDSSALIPPSEREIIALNGMHLSPFYLSTSRAKAIVSAMRYSATDDVDAALQMISHSKSPGAALNLSNPIPLKYTNCTHALVASFLYLCDEGFKLSLEASNAGYTLACDTVNDSYTCMKSLFSLLSAAALSGDRKYEQAIRKFKTVRDYARTVDDNWLEDAASRGLIKTTICAYGRESSDARKAVEEAATSTHNRFGVLESIWSDAIYGDVQIDRMTAFAREAIAVSSDGPHKHQAILRWEYTLLASRFSNSSAEIAAIASIRLGQMILKEEGMSIDSLTKAQKCQMEAAGLVKGWSDPFAHLGYIFEQFAKHRDPEKMILRAIRCYERALASNSAHVLAGRRLARLLICRDMLAEAAEIARRFSDRNPKGRWAFNILGWWRISRERYSEAASAFQAALRGKPRKNPKEKDTLFGTDVGLTIDDNDLLVDIDSWRGLSLAYIAQGKVGAAMGCLQDAIDLTEKPPSMYNLPVESEFVAARKSWQALLHLEKSTLIIMSRRSHHLSPFLETVIGDGLLSPMIINWVRADALMYAAAAEWSYGSYNKSFQLRNEAAKTFEEWLINFQRMQPLTNCAALYKRLGDMWMEAAGDPTVESVHLVSTDFVDAALSNALLAYSKARHMAPWDLKERSQDIAAVLQRKSVLTKNSDMAKAALNLVVSASCEAPLIAIAFMTFALLSPAPLKDAAKALAFRLSQSLQPKSKYLLDASIALMAEVSDDTDMIATVATSVARADPTDWRTWYVIGKAREVDAERHDWNVDLIESCERAYMEAERLGGGPGAVNGILRCVLRRLETYRGSENLEKKTYYDACYGLSLSGRLGGKESQLCRSLAETFIRQQERYASLEFERLVSMKDASACHSHMHMFPFLRNIRPVSQVSPAG